MSSHTMPSHPCRLVEPAVSVDSTSDDSPLLNLPPELIQAILGFLGPRQLASVAQTCRALHKQSYDDSLWHPLVNDSLPEPITTAGPSKSFRELYKAHYRHWFLPKQRIWFADSEPSGKLLLARYNEETGSIVAHAITAFRGEPGASFWEKDSEVIVHNFHPKISLDVHRPAVKVDLESPSAQSLNDHPSDRAYAQQSAHSKETLMETSADSGLYSSLMLCRALPESAITENTQVWPPLRIPAESRTRNVSQDGYNSTGHRPTTHSEVSQSNFRLRRWVEYAGRRTRPNLLSFGSGALNINLPGFGAGGAFSFGAGGQFQVPEVVTTYATLPESCYIPTPEKPWQGIWCGDYCGHGCEFLLITQPDEGSERPLPRGMNWLCQWLRGYRRASGGRRLSQRVDEWPTHNSTSQGDTFVAGTTDVNFSAIADDTESMQDQFEDMQDDIEAPGVRLDGFRHPPVTTPARDVNDYANVPKGRLEGIKLTGDLNVPRGEYSFIAPDIGHGGFVRIADESLFRGARVVRSAGHIAGRNFRHDQYTPSNLIMVSHDRLAQFWQGFGHISYYQRVDLDELTRIR